MNFATTREKLVASDVQRYESVHSSIKRYTRCITSVIQRKVRKLVCLLLDKSFPASPIQGGTSRQDRFLGFGLV